MYRRTSLLRQPLIVLLAIACMLPTTGCAGFLDYRREQGEKRKLMKEEPSFDWLDANWKSGYGFNNPNAERIRQGLEPVNFDGSLDSEKEEDGFFDEMINNFLGDSLGYSILWTFAASRVLFRRAFSRE